MELVIITTLLNHPLHLHGQNFYVLGAGLGTFDPIANAQDLNFVNPVRRDTQLIPWAGSSGWTVLR